MASPSLRAVLALSLVAGAGAVALACKDTTAPATIASGPVLDVTAATLGAAFTGNLDKGVKIMTHPQRPVKIVSTNVLLDGSDADNEVAGVTAGHIVDWHTHPGPTMGIVTGGTLAIYHADNCQVDHYAPGDVFFAPEGIHLAANEGATDIVVRVTFFLPADAPPTVLEPAEFTACGK